MNTTAFYSREVTELLKTGTIYGINGPVIYLKGNTGFRMSEMVYVGHEKLVGEVISLDKDLTTIQVYEETTGLRPGEEVTATGSAVSVTLAPGILNNIFDGIERPLEKIAETGGAFITRGVSVDNLDRTKNWSAHLTVSAYHRYDVPHRKRRYGCEPGRVRNRKDNDAAPDRQMV